MMLLASGTRAHADQPTLPCSISTMDILCVGVSGYTHMQQKDLGTDAGKISGCREQ